MFPSLKKKYSKLQTDSGLFLGLHTLKLHMVVMFEIFIQNMFVSIP